MLSDHTSSGYTTLLNCPTLMHQLGISQKGAIMEGLNMEIIKDLRIPFPPYPLQQHFALMVDRLFQSLLHKAFHEDGN